MNVVRGTRNEAVQATSRRLALEGFTPPGEQKFPSDPAWAALRDVGTRLWLDTGDLETARRLWSAEFSNLTTNNTLVNQEVQKGVFDEAIRQTGRALQETDSSLTADEMVIEIGFVVNCRAALRLVESFDAAVSVELHPGMSEDAELSLRFGRRYYAVCPERFIVKVPLTPAGFLAARRLAAEGIPVNFTLGFSARQNVLAAAFARPAYVNVFMGRLNSFVSDHGLGDGRNVGERTAMATQMALVEGRERRGWESLLIGASMRSAAQIWDLAGLDVFTMPPAAAEEYREQYHREPRAVTSQIGRDFPVDAEPWAVLDVLWTVPDGIYQAADALSKAQTDRWTGGEFAAFVGEHGAPDLFREWTPAERMQIMSDGKIPRWSRWRDALGSGEIALDTLMSESALYSFVSDQAALDRRIRGVLVDSRLV